GSIQFPGTKRLALGVLLAEPTATKETGYARLRHFIDVVPEGEATDFVYQVNRPRRSTVGVPDFVNRLAKWSVAQMQLVLLTAGAAPASAEPVSFVSLDLDVNTPAEFGGPIPPASVGAVLDDLWAGALEIATVGDRAR